MKNVDTKSLRVFEDMKSRLYERGYGENHLTINDEDPLRYEAEIDTSDVVGAKNQHPTLWAHYLPERQYVFVGVTFPDRIAEEKVPFAIKLLNVMNSSTLLHHVTMCPVCHRIDAVSGLSLINSELPKEEFQILLSTSESNASFLHSLIRQIADVQPNS